MENKLRTVILEDEDHIRQSLVEALLEFDDLELVGEAATINDSFRLISTLQPDVAYMDIKLIGGDIFNLLTRLRNNNVRIPLIVVTTGFPEYVMTAINDYHAHIVQYIVKPYSEGLHEKLRKSIDALWAAYSITNFPESVSSPMGTETANGYIFINNKKNFIRLDFEHVAYLEAAGNGATYIVTDAESIRIDNTINKCLEEIFPAHFLRISKSNAVNKDKILRINRDDRTLDVQVGAKEKNLGVGEVYYGELVKELIK